MDKVIFTDGPINSGPPVAAEMNLSVFEKIWNLAAVRKTVLILCVIALWEGYARYLDNPLIFPSFLDTLSSLIDNTRNGVLPLRVLASLKILIVGYLGGVFLAATVTVLAINSRIGADLLETLTAMFNPLPAIALLPLSLIWFGLGPSSIVFVLIHSVLWSMALNTHTGFLGVSQTLRMVGRNYDLRGLRYIFAILVPAALPSIVTGLKLGWAFAWRTMIAAELVFGVSSGQGGVGWFIFEHRNMLETDAVFAGLLTVIIIGLFVESVLFGTLERHTIRRWNPSADD